MSKKLSRERFRNDVFSRDDYSCKCCGIKRSSTIHLDAHHITDRNEMPNGGYVKENGISLCPSCHLKAEKYHSSNKAEWMNGFHPTDLYRLINSTKQKAIECSHSLKE